jgi:glutamate/aspartate transport system substrate-binding protein
MDTKWLEDFIVFAPTRRFSRAALHITQPAFSHRIQALEAWRGVELIVRTSYPPSLTAAGEAFYARAGDVMARIAALRSNDAHGAEQDASSVSIALPHTLSLSVFPHGLTSLVEVLGRTRAHLQRLCMADRADGLRQLVLERHRIAFFPQSDVRHTVAAGRLVALPGGLQIDMEIRAYRERPSLARPSRRRYAPRWQLLASRHISPPSRVPVQSVRSRSTPPAVAAPGRRRSSPPPEGAFMTTRLKIFGALLFASVASGALAQGTLDKVRASGTITIGHRDASIPFSYLDDKQQPIGYAMDLCARVIEAIKAELKLPALKVAYQPVTSATRIPLLANGTIDIECGSTTNNVERQRQVGYTMTHFLTASRYIAKKSDNLRTLAELKGKTVVSTSGSTNIKQLTELNAAQNLGINILAAKDHAEAFLMVDTGRAVAFVMDDILLASLAASHANPGLWQISTEALSLPEPYGIMLRKDDPAFKKLVDATMVQIYKSGEINRIYAKWFQSAIPPKGINLNLPMAEGFRKLVANPTDSPDPAAYR